MRKKILLILGLFESQDNNRISSNFKKHFEVDADVQVLAPFSLDVFGTKDFISLLKEVRSRITSESPDVVVAHSLGAYLTMHCSSSVPVFFLDPSLGIDKIIKDNVSVRKNAIQYSDGDTLLNLSETFYRSLHNLPSIDELCAKFTGDKVYIFGAGKGGSKVAQQYAKKISKSEYFELSEANHDFDNPRDQYHIIQQIKKELSVMPSS